MKKHRILPLVALLALVAGGLTNSACSSISPETKEKVVGIAEQILVSFITAKAAEHGWTPEETRDATAAVAVALAEEAPLEARSRTAQPVPSEELRAAARAFWVGR